MIWDTLIITQNNYGQQKAGNITHCPFKALFLFGIGAFIGESAIV